MVNAKQEKCSKTRRTIDDKNKNCCLGTISTRSCFHFSISSWTESGVERQNIHLWKRRLWTRQNLPPCWGCRATIASWPICLRSVQSTKCLWATQTNRRQRETFERTRRWGPALKTAVLVFANMDHQTLADNIVTPAAVQQKAKHKRKYKWSKEYQWLGNTVLSSVTSYFEAADVFRAVSILKQMALLSKLKPLP